MGGGLCEHHVCPCEDLRPTCIHALASAHAQCAQAHPVDWPGSTCIITAISMNTRHPWDTSRPVPVTPNHSRPSSAAFPTFCPLSYAYEWCRVLGVRGAAPSRPCASPPGPLVFPVGAPGIVYLLLLPTVAHGHICHTSPGALTPAPTCLHAHMDADRHTQLHTHTPGLHSVSVCKRVRACVHTSRFSTAYQALLLPCLSAWRGPPLLTPSVPPTQN